MTVRHITDEMGDLSATPGSRLWAIAVADVLRRELHTTTHSREHLDAMTTAFREHEGWHHLITESGRAFGSWREFCEARVPFGLGYDPEALDKLLREARSVEERRRRVYDLSAQGKSSREIAETLGVDRATVLRDRRTGANAPHASEPKQQVRKRGSVSISVVNPLTAAQALSRHFSPAQLEALIEHLQYLLQKDAVQR